MAARGDDEVVVTNTKSEETGAAYGTDKTVSNQANTSDQVQDSKQDDADVSKSNPKTRKRRQRPRYWRKTPKDDSNSTDESNEIHKRREEGGLEENRNQTGSVKRRDEASKDAYQEKGGASSSIGQGKKVGNIRSASSKQNYSSQTKSAESTVVTKNDPEKKVAVLIKEEKGVGSVQPIRNRNCEKKTTETKAKTLNRKDDQKVQPAPTKSNKCEHRATISKQTGNSTGNTNVNQRSKGIQRHTEHVKERDRTMGGDKVKSIKEPSSADKSYTKYRNTSNNANQAQSSSSSSSKKKLYVVIGEPVTEHSRVKEYLKHRMGDSRSTEFTIELIKELIQGSKKGCYLIVVCFSSYRKADAARHKLHQSNINTSNKIRCYLTEDEAIDNVEKVQPDYKSLKRKQVEELTNIVREKINKHDEKIIQIKVGLEELGHTISNKRGIPLHQFETLTTERSAHEEKLEELERQRKVFTQYVQSMRKKIEESDANENLEKDMKEIRKAFGIECRRLETALPMYSRREEILTTIKNNQVSVILGETGSGKSTQMVQYLYQAGFANAGRIVCTQPRKIAAVSLATHVAKELTSSVGQVVGYQVGMHSKKTAITKILFTTDHALLNECLRDRDLSAYSCIIVDEAHERSINTDLLLGMLKECIERRPELRVVITSATIDPDVFVSYFGGAEKCPVLKVSGRAYPVDVFWESESEFDSPFPEDYESKALNKAVEVHLTNPVDHGDIIIFLTSAIETERCCEKFRRRMTGNNSTCLPLHGKLRAEEQNLVFAERVKGKRKIVFATNSAETSITIPGIKFVIDTGVVKEMRYDSKKNMNSLDVVSVSQSSANQRKGRAGRTTAGTCYRLYTQTDFDCMNKSSSPEILRIHLGQGILKLLELGVDPFTFEFVQAPASSAMNAAVSTLQDVGAIEDHKITELGKWLAQLPLEPRLGVLLKNGIDEDVPIETLVVAASASQNSIYFRAGSPEEKKKADLKKMKFCHMGGDMLTILNVFREWDVVHEKAKGKWCVQNSINGKVMKAIRETMNEILNVLKKDMNLTIKHEFRKPEEIDGIIQKLIFKNMKSNISFYLGHEDAGYLTTDQLMHVQVHPSSSLQSLGQHPTWVVYSQLLKTSDDFITNVTPVPEEHIDDAIRNQLVHIDKDQMEARRVHQALAVPVGRHMFWKFVGPKHANRRDIENNIREACENTTVIVEADKIRGEIKLYCVPRFDDTATTLLRDAMKTLPEQLLLETREEEIGDKSGVRALIGVGAETMDILMPDQYRSVNVKEYDCNQYELTEDDVRERVSQYGNIEQIWKPNTNGRKPAFYWGKVTFVDELCASAAVGDINEDEQCAFSLKPITYKSQIGRKPDFTLKLKWCRRPCKGLCFIDLDRPEDTANLMLEPVEVDGTEIRVLEARGNQSDLCLMGVPPDITEHGLKEALCSALGVPLQGNYNRFTVKIIRGHVAVDDDEMERIKRKLYQKLCVYVPQTDFKLNVREYKQQTVNCIAFVKFEDPDQCEITARGLVDDEITIDGNMVEVEMDFKSTVFIQKRLYDIIKATITRYIERKRNNGSSTKMEQRTLPNGNIAVDINAVSARKLATVKVEVDKIVDGDVLHCGTSKNIHVLFSLDCRQHIQEIERTTGTLITVDQRVLKVTIQGTQANRQKALSRIEKYIEQLASAVEREFCLKGESNPPGMMKGLVVKYGTNLAKFREQTGVMTAKLNLRAHVLTVTGTDDTIKRASDVVELLQSLLSMETREPSEDQLGDCPVCLCPVELAELCRLELCGHAYCKECLKTQIQTSVRSKDFPVMCAKEGCEMPLVARDINAQIKQGNLNKAELVEAAVGSFVVKNNSDYKYCISADCAMVYRVTSDGAPFRCSLCLTNICTACHMKYHDGMTCGMYRSAKQESNTLQVWLKEKPDKCKLCPKCSVGIEKIEGCDHMTCKCGAHICWKCMRYFNSGQQCYGHLQKEHGSFV